MNKPFAESCEENKRPILQAIAPLLAEAHSVLEIGSGTGQHAVHFAAAMPRLTWQTSDRAENLPGIRLWIEESGLKNLPPPIALDVTRETDWPEPGFDAVFSANTAHIMSWTQVRAMLQGIGRVLSPGGCFALYGPFNYSGRYTSDSNARFDLWLRGRDPQSGIRNYEDLVDVGRGCGLEPFADIEMPVNNRTLVWRSTG